MDTSELKRKALQELQRRQGRASAADLASAVFAVAGDPSPWTRLLDRALAGDPEIIKGSGDEWRLARLGDRDRPPRERAVAIDVRATGADPARHRLAEIAIALADDESGTPSRVVAFQLDPGPRRVPRYAGSPPRVPAGSRPTFAEIAPELLGLLGGAPLVAIEASTVVAFLNRELQRAGRLPYGAPVHDLCLLADATLPGLGKPTLGRVAARLGLGMPVHHTVQTDARLVALAASRLRSLAPAVGTPPARTPADARERRPSVVPGLQTAPDGPGVYVLRDANGEALYVGKSRRLLRRVRSYFSGMPRLQRNLDGLVDLVRSVDTLSTDGELRALLLEDRLIRVLRPRYNVQRRVARRRTSLAVDDQPYPRLRLAAAGESGRVVVRFRTAALARDVLRLVDDLWQLRSCRRSFRRRRRRPLPPCPRGPAGLCLAPCDPELPEAVYQARLAEVLALLEADADRIVAGLRARLGQVERGLGYARAADFRQRLATIERALLQSTGLLPGGDALLIEPSWQGRYVTARLLVRDCLAGEWRVSGLEDLGEVLGRMRGRWESLSAPASGTATEEEVAAARVSARWVQANQRHPGLLPFAGGFPAEEAVNAVVASVLRPSTDR